MKKLLTAWIAGAVAMIVLSYIWHDLLMLDFYKDNMRLIFRLDVKFEWVVAGYVLLGLLMAYIFPLGFKGGKPINEGIRFGVLMGLVAFLPSQLVLYGLANIDLNAALVESAWHVVEQGVGGLVIALAYDRF